MYINRSIRRFSHQFRAGGSTNHITYTDQETRIRACNNISHFLFVSATGIVRKEVRLHIDWYRYFPHGCRALSCQRHSNTANGYHLYWSSTLQARHTLDVQVESPACKTHTYVYGAIRTTACKTPLPCTSHRRHARSSTGVQDVHAACENSILSCTHTIDNLSVLERVRCLGYTPVQWCSIVDRNSRSTTCWWPCTHSRVHWLLQKKANTVLVTPVNNRRSLCMQTYISHLMAD